MFYNYGIPRSWRCPACSASAGSWRSCRCCSPPSGACRWTADGCNSTGRTDTNAPSRQWRKPADQSHPAGTWTRDTPSHCQWAGRMSHRNESSAILPVEQCNARLGQRREGYLKQCVHAVDVLHKVHKLQLENLDGVSQNILKVSRSLGNQCQHALHLRSHGERGDLGGFPPCLGSWPWRSQWYRMVQPPKWWSCRSES